MSAPRSPVKPGIAIGKGFTSPRFTSTSIWLVSALSTSLEVLIAAVLHDVLEDTPTSAAEVEHRFGARGRLAVGRRAPDRLQRGARLIGGGRRSLGPRVGRHGLCRRVERRALTAHPALN